MPIEIRMPALSPTMTEGNLARWLKKEGDEVHAGDVIAEIETDKATMEYEAADEGRIGKIIVPEGAQGIKVHEPIALLLEEGEDPAALEKFADKVPSGNGQHAEAAPAPPAQPPAERSAPAQVNGGRVFASPLARRMAQQAGLDLTAIRGSGPQGRIVKADIDKALGAPAATPARAPVAAPEMAPVAPSAPVFARQQVLALAGNPPYSEKPHSAMRRVIARRLSESKQTVPHFYLSIDCTIDELLKIRKALNDKAPNDQGSYRISVNDFVIRAAALALRQVPAANASWSDEAILLWDRVDIGLRWPLMTG
jgi:pyruvate dehydrogenase E2 component (dihydrolipoamide acetyltransferase)